MKKIFFKIFLLLFLSIFSISKSQKKENKIDSLIIEMNLDPGSGPDFNNIKIYFNQNDFVVKYELYDGFDKNGYLNDSDMAQLREEYRDTKAEDIPDSYKERIKKARARHTKLYTREITLKDRRNKKYLSELYKVSNLSQQDIENEKNKKASYIHGVGVTFYFYKGSEKKSLVASALEKDNFGTLYSLLINTLDLYRKQNTDEKFNSKTFGY